MSKIKLIGKDNAYNSVMSAYKLGRLSHALLLCGDKGIGKSTFADEICKLLVCSGEDKPCNRCVQCEKVDKEIHPDIYKIYFAGKSQTIGVKQIAPIKDNIYIKPNDAECKIFIIYNAERMNRNAQNAILKMIEEPPEDTYFIFTCENPQALLPTVRSRVTSVFLECAQLYEVKEELSLRFPSLSEKKVEEAARLSGGNLGLAISICEDPETTAIFDDAKEIALAVVNRDKAILSFLLSGYIKKKDLALRLIGLLKLIFRDVSACIAGGTEFLSGFTDTVNEVSIHCSVSGAMRVIDACDEFISANNFNANLALAITAFEIKLADIRR